MPEQPRSQNAMKDYLLDQSNVQHFSETAERFKLETMEILQTTDKPLSLGLSGGAQMGILQWHIVKYMMEHGVDFQEYVGNSIGAILSALFATGHTDKKFFDFFMDGIQELDAKTLKENLTVYTVAKLVPFLVKVQIKGKEVDVREQLMQNYDKIYEQLKLHQEYGAIWTQAGVNMGVISIILCEILDVDIDDLQTEKINFNDVKREHGVNLGVMVSALGGGRKQKLAGNIGKTLKKGLTRQIKVSDMCKRITCDMFKKLIERNTRTVVLKGSYPVIDALVLSTSLDGLKEANIKGVKIKGTDGFLSGGHYPTLSKHYGLADSTKVEINPDPSSIPNWMWMPNFGENDVVISPEFGHKTLWSYMMMDFFGEEDRQRVMQEVESWTK